MTFFSYHFKEKQLRKWEKGFNSILPSNLLDDWVGVAVLPKRIVLAHVVVVVDVVAVVEVAHK